MKVRFPAYRRAKEKQKMDKMTKILREVPVTILLNGDKETHARVMSLYSPVSVFPLNIPSGSMVEVHDWSLCEYSLGRSWSDRNLEKGRDATLTYTRPPALTGTRHTTYEFPIYFED